MASCPGCGRELPGDFPFCPYCGTELAAAPTAAREQRKVVTVLFCDVTGSTELGEQLDPEALRTLLARYFEQMKTIVERHGGSVEKFIGDAVVAVFGVPVVHEDDALRAVRAAVEMRDAFPALGCQGRIGLMTGEVVTGTTERLATGDAVNVAARLEQAAEPGQILIGGETFRLTRDAIDVEAVDPLSLKGKAEPVPAYRLLSVHGDEPVARQPDTPMVGRWTELDRLRNAFDQAASDRSCQLFTVLGPAGVGKSRLVLEFLTSLDGALVVRGRCLPYGDGITYWPVVEVVKQLPKTEFDDVGADTITGLASDKEIVTSREEIAWAFRRLLEVVAAQRPLVCVFDDLQWGEETFLDLVEHIADLSRDAPILLLCLARPELLDRRPSWAGGKVNATSVLLEPLGAEETKQMIGSLGELNPELADRIREAAEGNPLFVEQMVTLAKESGNGDVTVPPTIQALLAARLDQLDPSERSVLERGSVEGRIFHRGAVQALAPEETELPLRLTALVRKELVRPDKGLFPGEDAFRFRHLLIRDAAYDALPKSARADLHEGFASWLEDHGHDLAELDEILGYHLEQACLYRRQLGAEPEPEFAREAASHLATSGRRAFVRGDMPAAVRFFERATNLLPEDDSDRLRLLPTLGNALVEMGAWERAEAMLSHAVTTAREAGDDAAAADAVVALTFVGLHTNEAITHAEAQHEIEAAIRVFEELGDKAGVARALALAGSLRFWRGDGRGGMEELERAAQLAREAGDRAQELQTLSSLIVAATYSSLPVPMALAKVEEIRRRSEGSRRLEVQAVRVMAELHAMSGRFDEARAQVAEARAMAEELGLELILAAGVLRGAGRIEILAGDMAAAEGYLERASRILADGNDWGHYASVAPELAYALIEQGRPEEAAQPLAIARERVLEDDTDAQVAIARAEAALAGSRGHLGEAEARAREAVERASGADDLDGHGNALVTLARILQLDGGREEQARDVLRQALVLFERKGNVVLAEHVRARLG